MQRSGNPTLKKWWWIAFGGLCSLLAAALLYWIALPPRGDPIRLLPAPTQSPYEVYVVGAVAQPGVYALPPGSRVKDAVQSAGGLLKEADAEAINLAALLMDGDRIRVPTQKAPSPSRPVSTSSGASVSTPNSAPGVALTLTVTAQLININTATLEELDTLPGIGPALASRIIAYRQLYGGFKAVQDIMNVDGIGPAIFSKIKDLITTGP